MCFKQCVCECALFLQLWQSAGGGLSFYVDSGNNADIKIRFVVGQHGDGVLTDGAGGTVVHSFPIGYLDKALEGEIHFDDDEDWSVDGEQNPPKHLLSYY